jgi:tRNA threonylcarbamoyladenosine biosynthesis protein TsaE
MTTFTSHSAAETVAFGQRMAGDLGPGDAVALHGELGAGKTCLVKGIARGLGVTQDVTSPTFTIVHEYRGGRLPLVHVDLYRLDTPQQAAAIGIEDYLYGKAVTVIEWAERIAPLLPPHTIHVRLEWRGENERTIVVS